ncbi:MAG TPA: methyltransferase domain-containing protein [Chitinophagales bacterium]|nr:methyltransferase domain-containing protein [Chitinophagales bacterium]
MKAVIKEFLPPVFLRVYRKIRRTLEGSATPPATTQQAASVIARAGDSTKQDLDVYWDLDMAAMLETWGKDHVWNEIQMLLVGKKGKALDIACGTGITIEIMSKYKDLEIYGNDISDLLIDKAVERGIDKKYLLVCDATNMPQYPDDFFDYSYSIGSLEHFTEEGIAQFVSEVHRITKYGTYHMMPTSRAGKNEGWIKRTQSYFNNSEQWWIDKFKTRYSSVHAINSGWKDEISIGKWFVGIKNDDKA